MRLPQQLVIYGVGGHAREILALVEAVNANRPTFEVLGWLDDRAEARGESLLGMPLYGSIEDAATELPHMTQVVIGIGSPAARKRIVNRLQTYGFRSPRLVHPAAVVGPRVLLGEGSMICAGAILTADINIGAHVIVNSGAIVSHDATLHDYSTIAPGCSLAGGVEISEGANVGVGASILPGVSVGSWSIVGAAACITKSVPENTTVVGIPGRVIRTRAKGWEQS